jgi:hypothetical protein
MLGISGAVGLKFGVEHNFPGQWSLFWRFGARLLLVGKMLVRRTSVGILVDVGYKHT